MHTIVEGCAHSSYCILSVNRLNKNRQLNWPQFVCITLTKVEDIPFVPFRRFFFLKMKSSVHWISNTSTNVWNKYKFRWIAVISLIRLWDNIRVRCNNVLQYLRILFHKKVIICCIGRCFTNIRWSNKAVAFLINWWNTIPLQFSKNTTFEMDKVRAFTTKD